MAARGSIALGANRVSISRTRSTCAARANAASTAAASPSSQSSAMLPGAFRPDRRRILRHCALHVRRGGERIELDLNRFGRVAAPDSPSRRSRWRPLRRRSARAPRPSTGIVAWNIGLPSRPLKEATGGMSPMLSAARSRPVITAMTPGIFIADATSILRMIGMGDGRRARTRHGLDRRRSDRR